MSLLYKIAGAEGFCPEFASLCFQIQGLFATTGVAFEEARVAFEEAVVAGSCSLYPSATVDEIPTLWFASHIASVPVLDQFACAEGVCPGSALFHLKIEGLLATTGIVLEESCSLHPSATVDEIPTL